MLAIQQNPVPVQVRDHVQAKARALAVLQGGDPLVAARDAFNSLAERNRDLLGGDRDAIRSAVADQVQILEAVVLRYAVEAEKCCSPDHQRALAGVAIRASATLTQTLLALHRLNEEARNAQAIEAE